MKAIEPTEPAGAGQHPMVVKGFDRLLTTQRPAVLAHVRSIRKRHPEASPARVIQILERRYLAAVTTGGAGVGAAAVIPGVGTGASLALTGVETAGFLETTALFAQSVTEIHGIAVTDPDRARTIVMAMMLGTSGADLVRNLAAQATGKGVPRTTFWGDVIGRSVPQAFMGEIAGRMQKHFLRRFARNTATGAVGRLVPFGIGAVLGGTGNHLLGRKVVNSSRVAFGPPPAEFPPNLEPRPRRPKVIKTKNPDAPGAAERLGRLNPLPRLKQLTTGRRAESPTPEPRASESADPGSTDPGVPDSGNSTPQNPRAPSIDRQGPAT